MRKHEFRQRLYDSKYPDEVFHDSQCFAAFVHQFVIEWVEVRHFQTMIGPAECIHHYNVFKDISPAPTLCYYLSLGTATDHC